MMADNEENTVTATEYGEACERCGDPTPGAINVGPGGSFCDKCYCDLTPRGSPVRMADNEETTVNAAPHAHPHARAGGIAHLLATVADLDPLELARVEAFARTLKADPEATRIVVGFGEEGRGSYLVDGVEVASSPTIHDV
jgi:hypothetical protein